MDYKAIPEPQNVHEQAWPNSEGLNLKIAGFAPLPPGLSYMFFFYSVNNAAFTSVSVRGTGRHGP